MPFPARWYPNDKVKSTVTAETAATIIGENKGLGFMYRFTDVCEGNEDSYSSTVKIYLTAYPIRTATKSGWTIKADNKNGWRFIGKEHHKTFACPTVSQAVISFLLRKKYQAAIYDARADNAREAAKAIKGSTHELD